MPPLHQRRSLNGLENITGTFCHCYGYYDYRVNLTEMEEIMSCQSMWVI